MKNNFLEYIKKLFYLLIPLGGLFMIIGFFVLFSILMLLFIAQFFIIGYSGFIFFKVIQKKLIEYGYDKKDPVELLCIKYGILIIYVLFIYLFCTHRIFGLPFIILLLFFNRALKKELKKDEKEER
jgi:hypothetical protein